MPNYYFYLVLYYIPHLFTIFYCFLLFPTILSFYSLSDCRKHWIESLKNHQNMDLNKQLFICELHFLPQYIYRSKNRTNLHKDVFPSIKYDKFRLIRINNKFLYALKCYSYIYFPVYSTFFIFSYRFNILFFWIFLT